jgi:hypothetical protein
MEQMRKAVTDGVHIRTPSLLDKIRTIPESTRYDLVFHLERTNTFSDAYGGGEDYKGHTEIDGEKFPVSCRRQYDMGMGSQWNVKLAS